LSGLCAADGGRRCPPSAASLDRKEIALVRTFIAVFPPRETREEIGELMKRLSCAAPEAKWVKPESLHFTLRFLGNLPEERLDDLAACVAQSVEAKAPFELVLKGLGAFPSPRRPRVLWVGAGTGGDELAALARAVESALRAERFGKADKPFSPHLTLARWRYPHKGEAVRNLIETESIETGPFTIREVHVMESKLRPGGPEYISRATCRLCG